MTKKNKIMLGAGAGFAVLAAAAGIAVAAPDGPHRTPAADVNKDGHVTTAEIQHTARQRFAAFDVNGDGSLTGAEIQLLHEGRGGRGGGGRGQRGPMGAEGPQQPPAQAASAEQSASPRPLQHDFDGNGAISLPEFQRGMATRYILLDADRNGTVSPEELKAGRHGRRGSG